MPAKAKGKATKKPEKQALKKKRLKKRTVKKITVKKKSAKKKTAGKKTVKKKPIRRLKTRKPAGRPTPAKEPVTIEPGPPGLTVPPVEEPATNEEAIGTVTHYYSHLGVAVVQINKGTLRTGDFIRLKGHTTDFTQQIDSMEYEHQHVEQATAGQSVGLKVLDHAREHDILYRLK
jgi:putative protease